jgi:small nuclear ribonucleoprotein G
VVADFHIQYLDKRLFVQLNGSRKVIGVLRGYDVGLPIPTSSTHSHSRALLRLTLQVFLNIVLDDAVEEKDGGEKVRLGMVVCSRSWNCDRIVGSYSLGHSRKFGCYA